MRTVVLASGSIYRRELLGRLGIEFESASADIDESRRPGESPGEMVERLSFEKAKALADRYPESLIIGSDQCAVIGEEILGKPGDFDQAFRQLRKASGKTVAFHTGLCLLDARDGSRLLDDVEFEVRFRELSDDRIAAYLRREQPWDCAGSFKSEGLGVALFAGMRGDDPSALMGLPLIRLVTMLEAAGLRVL